MRWQISRVLKAISLSSLYVSFTVTPFFRPLRVTVSGLHAATAMCMPLSPLFSWIPRPQKCQARESLLTMILPGSGPLLLQLMWLYALHDSGLAVLHCTSVPDWEFPRHVRTIYPFFLAWSLFDDRWSEESSPPWSFSNSASTNTLTATSSFQRVNVLERRQTEKETGSREKGVPPPYRHRHHPLSWIRTRVPDADAHVADK